MTPDRIGDQVAGRLLSLAARDIATRNRVAHTGRLELGYHPEMRAVHEANADELADILTAHGWPDAGTVGPEAAEAAWLVVQPAISRPDLMRAAVPLLAAAGDEGKVPAHWLAHLTDRICYMEGRPQLYGTQLDREDDSRWGVYQLQDPSRVDALRAGVGLEPLEANASRAVNETGPPMSADELRRWRAEAERFAHDVGWR